MMTRLPVSVRIVLFTLAAGLLASLGVSAAGTLDIYFIDVEGGQATLLVTPTGQSMLIDAGWDGFDNRDPKRILAAARDAGIKRIDYLVITHFHRDHVGGVPALAQQIPIGTFVDYGEPIEAGDFAQAPFKAYVPIRAAGSSRRAGAGRNARPARCRSGDRDQRRGRDLSRSFGRVRSAECRVFRFDDP
jgi:beta-lactamase superfamily II metal-dependent hydrolase